MEVEGQTFFASTALFRRYPVRRQRHSAACQLRLAFCVTLKFLQHEAAIERTFSMIMITETFTSSLCVQNCCEA